MHPQDTSIAPVSGEDVGYMLLHHPRRNEGLVSLYAVDVGRIKNDVAKECVATTKEEAPSSSSSPPTPPSSTTYTRFLAAYPLNKLQINDDFSFYPKEKTTAFPATTPGEIIMGRASFLGGRNDTAQPLGVPLVVSGGRKSGGVISASSSTRERKRRKSKRRTKRHTSSARESPSSLRKGKSVVKRVSRPSSSPSLVHGYDHDSEYDSEYDSGVHSDAGSDYGGGGGYTSEGELGMEDDEWATSTATAASGASRVPSWEELMQEHRDSAYSRKMRAVFTNLEEAHTQETKAMVDKYISENGGGALGFLQGGETRAVGIDSSSSSPESSSSPPSTNDDAVLNARVRRLAASDRSEIRSALYQKEFKNLYAVELKKRSS